MHVMQAKVFAKSKRSADAYALPIGLLSIALFYYCFSLKPSATPEGKVNVTDANADE